MKPLLLSLLLLIASLTKLLAQQVPNSGFENWSQPYNPDGWFTYTSYLNFLAQAFQDTDNKFEGNSSAKIQTISFAGSTTFESLVYGNFTYSPLQTPAWKFYPVYFPFRPDTLAFAYTYITPGVDSASAYVKLTSEAGVLIDTLIALLPNASWTPVSLHLTPLYVNEGAPDSLLLHFKSSKTGSNFFGVVGSTLNLDAVHFGYRNITSAFDEKQDSELARVFPNPANTQIAFQLQGLMDHDRQIQARLFDLAGREVLSQPLGLGTQVVSVAHLPAGIYTWYVSGARGQTAVGRVAVE